MDEATLGTARQYRLLQRLVRRLGLPVLALSLGGALLAGCSSGTPSADRSSASASPPASPSASPTGSGGAASPSQTPSSGAAPPGATTPPAASTGPAAGELTVTGDLVDGVEPSCLILHSAGEAYLLLGGDRSVLRSGAHVTVRGRLADGMVTTCQQGKPLQVLEARSG
jgi:hypothetical protein